MNAICCSPEAVGQPQRPEAEALAISAARLAVGLERSINQFVAATDQNLGSIELAVEKESRELLRQATEKAAQQKAEATPPICPVCQHRLSRLSTDHARTFESKFGPITVRRARGYCRRCRKWRFPADTVLGLEETGRLLTAGARDGGAVSQQDARGRGQCSAGALDRGQAATRQLGSGSTAAGTAGATFTPEA